MNVRADGGYVVVEGPGPGAMALTPEAAERSAERLLEAAEAARAAVAGQEARRKPPFPPAELVSPHGAS
jgi:hypothetical protein